MTLAQLEKGQPFIRASTLQPMLHCPLVRLLGEPSIKLEQWHPFISDRRYQVLAYLAHAGTWVSRDKLADLFYSDTNQSAARSNLRKILFKIKSLEWLENLEQNDEALRWQVETDVKDFLKAIEARDWERAIKRYSGSFLQGFTESGSDFDGWVEAERLRLEDLYQHAAEKHIETLEQRGDLDSALHFLQMMLARDPLLEAMHRRVIALEFRRGNTEAAFEQFERCREVLQKELGVEPEEETLELLRRLEQGTTQAKYAVVLKNPDAIPDAPQILFGREQLLQEMSDFLQQGERVLAQGFGGMGKTALAATIARLFLKEQQRPVLWLQVGADNPEVILEALARPFDAAQELAKAEDKTAYLKNVFSKQSLSLLVLDDVWNAYTLSKVMEALPKGLPLLVTSRQRYSRIKRVYVDRLERNAAVELLKHYANVSLFPAPPFSLEEREKGREGGLDALCELFGDHPFTLRIAGLNLRVGATVEGLLERIRSAPHDLKIPADFKEAGRESAASLLRASLEPLSDLEYEVFMTYGILASPSASAGLLACCANREQNKVEEALFNLVARGLAERVSKPGSDQVAFRLHDLAHSYVRTNRIQRPSTLIRAGLTWLREHKHDVLLLEQDIANLLYAAQMCRDEMPSNRQRVEDFVAFMYLLTVEGCYYTARGHNSRSVALLKVVGAVAEEAGRLEEAHYIYTKLGEYHLNFVQNYKIAFDYYSRARVLARQLNQQGREAITLGLMSFARFHQGEVDAEDLAQLAYKIAKASKEGECLAKVLGQLGYIAIAKGDMKSAKARLEESLAVLEKLSCQGSLSTSVTKELFFGLLNLGETEYRLGYFEAGVLARKKALELAEEQKNEVWMGYAHYEIGEMYHNVGQPDLAKQHMLGALHLFQNNHCAKDVEAVLSFLKAGNYSSHKDVTAV